MSNYSTSSKYYRLWLFWLGIIATIAYRIIIILNNISSNAVKISWYIGTIGFAWYFAHRFRVQNYRGKLITEKKILEKINEGKQLSEDDRDVLTYVLKSLKSTKAKWNYIAIFILSAIALIYGVITDFIID
ncbi:MAG: hypothetical protein ABIE43_05515 [Patescibacteria group bacterium]